MEFIIENYIWFVVVGVILLMALIGYIAEKTDFGRKEFEKKVRPVKEPKEKKKKEEKTEVTPVEVVEEIKAEEITDAEVITEENVPVLEEDLTVPLTDDSWGEPVLEKVEEVNFDEIPKEEIEQPLVETEQLETPVTVENTVEEVSSEIVENTVEEVPSEIVENKVEEIPSETVETETKNEENNEVVGIENLELPAIESLKEEESEDDVWKF